MLDPRVFFAAERTLLAWIRSGLAVMALGFVVAKFGLFLTLLAASNMAACDSLHIHWQSSALGIALVFVGEGITLGALQNHRMFVRSLPPEDIPKLVIPWLASFLSLSIAMVGFFLAVYLAIA